jgi:hypothetical protein
MARRKPLVFQHLEDISRVALKDYQSIIRDYVRGKQGIYALYRRGRLYYVGLASNLRGRLAQHLKDKHGQSWDRFSVYLTHDDQHLRELESLVLRIVKPTGNRQIGKFAKSENLKVRLGRDVRDAALRRADQVMGRQRRLPKRRPRRGRQSREHRASVLTGYFDQAMTLKGWRKGYEYTARLRTDGTIQYDGKVYQTPSKAAVVACERPSNGWWFWHYKNKRGDWTRLQELRR